MNKRIQWLCLEQFQTRFKLELMKQKAQNKNISTEYFLNRSSYLK